MAVAPIETRYAGCRFRSRREARWAVFFDQLGIPWEYEPEGYQLDQTVYLPDFLLYPNTDLALWFEVKGRHPLPDELSKAARLAITTNIRACVYFAGFQPRPGPGLSNLPEDQFEERVPDGGSWRWDNRKGWGWYSYIELGLPFAWEVGLEPTAYMFKPVSGGSRPGPRSGHWWWTDCPYCGKVIIKLHGQVGWCPIFGLDDPRLPEPLYPSFGHETQRLLDAYQAATSARFEYGEAG